MASRAAAYAAPVSTTSDNGASGAKPRPKISPRQLPPLHPGNPTGVFSPPTDTRSLAGAVAIETGSAIAPDRILSRDLLSAPPDARQQQLIIANQFYAKMLKNGALPSAFPPSTCINVAPQGFPHNLMANPGLHPIHEKQIAAASVGVGIPHLDTGAPDGAAQPASPTATGTVLISPSTGRTLEPPTGGSTGASPLSTGRTGLEVDTAASPTVTNATLRAPSTERTPAPTAGNGNAAPHPAPSPSTVTIPKRADALPPLIPVTHGGCQRRTLIGICVLVFALAGTAIGVVVCKLRKSC